MFPGAYRRRSPEDRCIYLGRFECEGFGKVCRRPDRDDPSPPLVATPQGDVHHNNTDRGDGYFAARLTSMHELNLAA